ncbi:Aste57867_14028 [Aphanomyces stellatus]|uniref:Aste57867_14028 protein n=1 Tax=Aphanomyces stellatus TaxID=120398 RepID=A0A485KZL7_9STRA|nr:hypothetical protein As57867_013977 [Aphanomyces stellatus]VFT90858.1 Aste57867_14028 [Aphanomyces stellatus]
MRGTVSRMQMCVRRLSRAFTCPPATLGSAILGTVYLSFMFSAMAGPFLPHYFGEKLSMVGSSSFYGFFALANLIVAYNPTHVALQWWLMIASAAFLGVSASFLWISQASYLTQLSVLYSKFLDIPKVSSVGFFNGLFYSIFKFSGITGNLISSIVLGYFTWSTTTLFAFYSLLSFSGTALLCFVPTLPPAPLDDDDDDVTEATRLLHPATPLSTLRSLVTLAIDPRMLVLAPTMILNGIQQAFLSGEFTSNFIRESLGSASIGYVFVLVGLVSVTSSFVFGKLADRFGPLCGQLVCFSVLLAAYLLCYVAHVTKCDGHWSLVLVVAVLLSMGDCSSSTLVNVVLGQEFPSDTVNAFSVFRVYHAGGTSFSFFYFPSLSFHGRLVLLGVWIVLSVASYMVYYTRFRRVQ